MRPRGLIALALALATPPARGQEPGTPRAREAAAHQAADGLPKLLDARRYGESWDRAAEGFRQGITRQARIDAPGATRKPIGKPRGRKLDRIELKARARPEAPDEARVYYDLRPAAGGALGELLIVVIVKDEAWRHSGDFVGARGQLPRPPETRPCRPPGPRRPINRRPSHGIGGAAWPAQACKFAQYVEEKQQLKVWAYFGAIARRPSRLAKSAAGP